MTTLENVTTELTNKGIKVTGINSELPTLTYKLIIQILNFGEGKISSSILGSKVKQIALELAKKDGRKSIVCPITYKNILV